MNDELFDEPRKCSKCDVVTYCDNCPVCGKSLPRSSRAMWKMIHKHDVAGEEGITNDLKHERFEERILETMHHGTSGTVKKKQATKVAESNASFDQKNTGYARKDLREANSSTNQVKGTAVAKIIAIIIVILVFISLVGIMSSGKIEQTIDEVNTTIPSSNSTEIISNHAEYDHSNEKSTISLKNKSGKAYYGDITFYNQNEEQISEYTDIVIFPYETFYLEVNTEEEVYSFEIDKMRLQRLDTEPPLFPYETFSDSGVMTISLAEDIEQRDLEILVQHMYEASSVDEFESIYEVEIFVNDELLYTCFVDDFQNKVTVYPSGNVSYIQDIYEFSLIKNHVERGTTKDNNL